MPISSHAEQKQRKEKSREATRRQLSKIQNEVEHNDGTDRLKQRHNIRDKQSSSYKKENVKKQQE
jgi:hypothetical protein